MPKVVSGLDVLLNAPPSLPTPMGLLCHSASITSKFQWGVEALFQKFPGQIKALFGPQHGFVCDVQDNMIETKDFIHPHFKCPVYSLYSETRIPTERMLAGLKCILVDLQDIGTRIYTYIYTLSHLMESCRGKDIKIIVLDRPNPIGAQVLAGNTLEEQFASFVGRHPLPVRHGLTIGEFALMAKRYFIPDGDAIDLEVISVKGLKRSWYFDQTELPWAAPSPNIPTPTSALTFPATVWFEGTNISEGRGTTRPLEMLGHPQIEPFKFTQHLESVAGKESIDPLAGIILRPIYFRPTFQKWAETTCGGIHIHVLDRQKYRPWVLGQFLCREFCHYLGRDFAWKKPPYEYETEKLPIDIINGSQKVRQWVENASPLEELSALEKGQDDFLAKRDSVLLYA